MRTAAADDPEPGPVSWRLLGGNHRELARSPRSYVGTPAARAAVLALQADLGSAVPAVLVVPATRLWTWRVRVDDEVQMVSSRSYQRRRESVSNLARALEALGAATFVAEELVLLSARPGAPRPSLASRLDSTAPDVA
jgi:hypothetical protein